MGDVDEGDPDLALDLLQLDLQALAQLQVERAERLVEQQHLRQVDQRPRQRHPLLHAAGELRGPPVRLAAPARPAAARPPPVRRSRPCRPSCASARRRRSSRRSCGGRARSSGRRCWSAACAAACPATFSPSIRTSPSVGCSKPAIIRSVVVLPQPLGPRKVKNSPCPSSSERSSTAVKVSKRLVTLRSATLWASCDGRLGGAWWWSVRFRSFLLLRRDYEHRPVGQMQKLVGGRAEDDPLQRRARRSCRRRSSARRAPRRPRSAPRRPVSGRAARRSRPPAATPVRAPCRALSRRAPRSPPRGRRSHRPRSRAARSRRPR